VRLLLQSKKPDQVYSVVTPEHGYSERIADILRDLGVPTSYGSDTGMPLYREATDLLSIGVDIYGREQRLVRDAAIRWHAMHAAARQEDVTLLPISGFRSVDYQLEIWHRKLTSGESVHQILRVSAPPGYSEHHSGRAVDITTLGCPPVTEEFESTSAFAWLLAHAKEFGFSMTYPRSNRFGVIYEPWHWAIQA